MGVGRFLQRHRAGGHFVQSIVDRAGFSHVRKRNVNGDVAVRAKSRFAIRSRQLRCARISQNAATANQLHVVLADETLQRGAIRRFGINVEIFSTV